MPMESLELFKKFMIRLIDSNHESRLAIEKLIQKIAGDSELHFTTSGTTGAPKDVVHSMDTITKHVKKDDRECVWGLTYEHSKMAGSQVIVQAYKNGNTLVNLYGKSTNEVHSLIKNYNITHISGTPTFFRLNFKEESFDSVKQITLGGEVVTERVVDLVKSIFPNANISNVYAMTEYGSILSSSSHLFTLSKRAQKTVRIEGNTLHVFFDSKWQDTGDVVDIKGDGAFAIVGRADSMINVGGQKVNPHMVEDTLNAIPGVISSRVYGKENSLTGNLVAADVMLDDDMDVKMLKIQLRERLKPYEVPRIIDRVEDIKTNATGKISRCDE